MHIHVLYIIGKGKALSSQLYDFCTIIELSPDFCTIIELSPGYDVKLHPAVTLLLSVGM